MPGKGLLVNNSGRWSLGETPGLYLVRDSLRYLLGWLTEQLLMALSFRFLSPLAYTMPASSLMATLGSVVLTFLQASSACWGPGTVIQPLKRSAASRSSSCTLSSM